MISAVQALIDMLYGLEALHLLHNSQPYHYVMVFGLLSLFSIVIAMHTWHLTL